MIKTQYINLDMTPSGVLPVLYCSQYDIGRPLGMVVYNGGESVDLSTYTCTIEATRTDGTAITAAVTTEGNIGAFVTTATMTNQKDRYPAKLVLFDSQSRRVASIAFVMCITPATMDENAEGIEEDKSLYQQYTEAVQVLIAEIREDLVDLDTRKIERHDTVAQMKANASLAPGMYTMTGGYRSVNDFGRAFYRINGTVPSTHYETLSNGNFAELVTDGNVTPEMFGAIGDGVADDTAAIKAALTSGCAVVFGQYRTYKITQDITFHTSLDLNFSTLYLVGCSLIVDDGLATQNHYGFGIIIENGFFVGDNTNTLIEVKHATKTTIENCAFKNFLTGILVTTGYEHKINGCRFIGNPSIHATAIDKRDGDGFVIDVTGVDCYKAIVIQKAKHYINNIHFWLSSPDLIDGSVMITYTGAGQSNLVIDYAYFDSYETGIYKSGLATLVLNSSNIVMPSSLWSGEYYLFEFGDADQNFLVMVNDFATPWSNETNFRISTADQSAIFYFNLTKASYRIIDVVKDYINSQITFKNGITATGVDVTFDKNLMRFKAILTMPSTLPSGGTICMSIPGIRFPDQSIKLFGGQYGTEYMSFDYENAFIRNSAGQTIDVDVMVKYFPQYT